MERQTLQEPELYTDIHQAVGFCLHMWSSVELAVADLWSALNDISEDASAPVCVTFDAVKSFEVRMAMLNAFIQSRHDLDTKFKSAWNSSFNKAMKLYSKRHQVAHFNIIFSSDSLDILDHRHADQARLQPFMTWSDWVGPVSRPSLSAEEIRARARGFDDFAYRIIRLAAYIRAHGDNETATLLQGADLDRLLDNPFDLSSLGIELPPESSQE